MTPLMIIPARGGSKGIPRKNVKLLGGRPLIAYTVSAALEACAGLGGAVILSTDDDEIAGVARAEGLSVDYMRPAELGGDNVGSREVILDVMEWADSHGVEYDCVILLQPTSPFRQAEDIEACAAMYSPDVDMVVSVCRSESNPYYNLFETDASGYLHVCKG
ncbi:MAG: acylneuraminate cytidylyltransferase family protein, partial [Muribaculaceae bacterium]|nr:acylneuraminate cytidylyltransferase family protein [Muribaculaceae bacterium]